MSSTWPERFLRVGSETANWNERDDEGCWPVVILRVDASPFTPGVWHVLVETKHRERRRVRVAAGDELGVFVRLEHWNREARKEQRNACA